MVWRIRRRRAGTPGRERRIGFWDRRVSFRFLVGCDALSGDQKRRGGLSEMVPFVWARTAIRHSQCVYDRIVVVRRMFPGFFAHHSVRGGVRLRSNIAEGVVRVGTPSRYGQGCGVGCDRCCGNRFADSVSQQEKVAVLTRRLQQL